MTIFLAGDSQSDPLTPISGQEPRLPRAGLRVKPGGCLPLPSRPPDSLPERTLFNVRIFVLIIGALLTAGLLFVAGHIAWRQFQRLAYVSRLDEWAEDLPEWH